MFPLLATAKKGDGTVLLQNHLGDFGLEKLLLLHRSSRFPSSAATNAIPATEGRINPNPTPSPVAIPGEGVIVSAPSVGGRFFLDCLLTN